MDQPLLTDVPQAKGHPIAHLLRISNVEIKVAKNGRKYLQFNLGDKSAEFKGCKKWESSDEEFERFKKCKVVFVTGKTDLYNGNIQVTCETLAEPEDSVEIADLESLVSDTQRTSEVAISDFKEHIKDQTLVKKLKPDDPVSHILRILGFEVKDAKNGRPFAYFKLGDSSGDFTGRHFDIPNDFVSKFKDAKAVHIIGVAQLYQGALQVRITGAEPILLADDDLQSLYVSSLYSLNFLKKEIWNFIQKIENPFIKQLAELTLKDPIVKERLGTWVAATTHHHNYRSGLCTHIYRLMVIADKFVDTINDNMYPGSKLKISKDMVILGCLLHDLWKILTYNEDGSFSNWGHIIEHLPYGPIDAARKMDQIKDFPDNLRNAIYHMVLAHHGSYGPTKPKTPEAIILHYLDDCFAKLDPCLEILENLPEGIEFSNESLKALDGKAWMGATLRIKEDESKILDASQEV